MGRNGYIALSVLGLAVWSSLGYVNVASAIASGLPLPYALFTPLTVGPIALVPLTLAQLWKLLAAERQENILDPDFVLRASQSRVARGISGVMFVAFAATGLRSLLGRSVASDLPDYPIVSVCFVAAGIYGATLVLFSRRIRIVLSPEGLEHSQMRPTRVPWHDIIDVKLRSFLTGSWIVLTLKNTTEFRSANLLARWRRADKVSIVPLVFGIDPEVLKQGIELRRNIFTFD
ncbi:MAG TPA: hypothetical protein VGF43_24560 [Dongiaceae bacterium]|jgi:hypothetical protein